MNYAEKIKMLDIAIANILHIENDVYENRFKTEHIGGNQVKEIAIEALRTIGCNEYIINSIKRISFESRYDSIMTQSHIGQDKCHEKRDDIFNYNKNSIVAILNRERENLIQQRQEKEQKTNRKIQVWALAFSAIAALGTIVTLLVSFFR